MNLIILDTPYTYHEPEKLFHLYANDLSRAMRLSCKIAIKPRNDCAVF